MGIWFSPSKKQTLESLTPRHEPKSQARVDLSKEMTELLERLGPPDGKTGRAFQFVSAESGEGASTMAREFARVAAERSLRGVWLVELDLMKSGQQAAVAADPERFGPLGKPVRASPDGSMFFTVQPQVEGADGQPFPDAQYLAAYRVGHSHLWITRFRRGALRPGQEVQIQADPSYWNALRRHADYIVVDAPALSQSLDALTLAPLMDATVLVVAADRPDVRAPQAARDAILQAGGACAGLVFNRAPPRAPPLVKSLWGRPKPR